jgi:hypothetical protein
MKQMASMAAENAEQLQAAGPGPRASELAKAQGHGWMSWPCISINYYNTGIDNGGL